MNTYKKVVLAAVALAPVALLTAPQANAQAIAVSDPSGAILNAKALGAANTQISTTYKAQLDQAAARQTALRSQIATLTAPLDTNGDKQISEAEVQAAQNAKNPILDKVRAAQTAGETEIAKMNEPAYRAQAYAIEQISQKYNDAVTTVATARKASVVLTPSGVQYAPPSADITGAVTTEIDRVLPSVTITPPANWQPSQDTVALQRQFQQVAYYQALRAQQAGAPAGARPAAAAPARGGKASSGR